MNSTGVEFYRQILFKRIEERTWSFSFYGVSITLKPDKDHSIKENCRPFSLITLEAVFFFFNSRLKPEIFKTKLNLFQEWQIGLTLDNLLI